MGRAMGLPVFTLRPSCVDRATVAVPVMGSRCYVLSLVESVLLSSSLCSHTDLIGGASDAHCVQAPSLWVPEYLDVEKW